MISWLISKHDKPYPYQMQMFRFGTERKSSKYTRMNNPNDGYRYLYDYLDRISTMGNRLHTLTIL